MSRTPLRPIVGAALVLSALCCAPSAACTVPMTVTWGVPDNFAPVPSDPIPYSPTAFPQFVAFLNLLGIPTSDLKTLDDFTADRHMVATLRHGMRNCFPQASGLQLCFHARAHRDDPTDDVVTLYDTDFGVYSFPIVYTSPIVPALSPSWTIGTDSFLCINLTMPMVNNQIGDMLQFHLQDDTAVDFITMTLF